MKVLIICSGNHGSISPFISEQVDSLVKMGIKAEYFMIMGKGIWGYLRNIRKLIPMIKTFAPDIIHAHYGLSALFANAQRKVPVISTFHGSDINLKRVNPFSLLAAKLSSYNIYVSQKIYSPGSNNEIIPCGIDIKSFYPIEREEARKMFGFGSDERLILFASAFDIKIKNYPLAKKAVNLLGEKVKLIELSGYSRQKVNMLLNACDLLLMTSFNEGSPQVVKEAMACDMPVVSTDVGDVSSLFNGLDGYYITTYDPVDVAAKLSIALDYAKKNQKTEGRNRIIELELDNDNIAAKIIAVYNKVLLGRKDYL